MTLETAAVEYENVQAELRAFMTDERASVVEDYEMLKARRDAAEKRLKEACVELESGTERVIGNILIKKTTQLTVDPVALSTVPGAQQVDGLFRSSIDSKILDVAVKAGLLNKDHVDACRTVPRATIVKIQTLSTHQDTKHGD